MDLKDWVKAALKHGKVTYQSMGDEMSLSKAAVGHWATGVTKPSFDQIVKIARRTGYPMPTGEALAPPTFSPSSLGVSEPQNGLDQSLSYRATNLPSQVPWERLKVVNEQEKQHQQVPREFVTTMPDAALAPKIAAGTNIWFKAASEASPRQVVLIEANGKRWIRRYAETQDGPQAQALDDAFPSFATFKVVAVMYMLQISEV